MSAVSRSVQIFAVVLSAVATCVSAAAQEWDASGDDAWRELLEAAQTEGSVVVFGPPLLQQPLTEAFEADTGIRVDYVTGGFRDLRVRYGREMEADQPSFDIYFGGSSSVFPDEKAGRLAAVSEFLVLPDVTDSSNWQDGGLDWLDNEERTFVQPNAYASGRVFVNSDVIDPDSVGTWADLLDPRFTGKIASHDPTFPGAGQAVATYLLHSFGRDFVEDFYRGQEVTYSREGRQLVEWLVRDTYPVIVGAIAFEVERFRDAGVDNIAVIEMEDAPGYLVGGSAIAVTPAKPPHPNAAAVFHNWYLSRRGQQIYADAMQVPSKRLDVDNGNSPFYVVPTEGIEYIDTYEEDWFDNRRAELREVVQEILAQ